MSGIPKRTDFFDCIENFPSAKKTLEKSRVWTDKEKTILHTVLCSINAAAAQGMQYVDVELPMYDKIIRFLEQKGYRLEYHPWSIICRIHW